MNTEGASIDAEVLAAYNAGAEAGRLKTGLGLIEFERTKQILLETLPPSPATVYDVGGGPGEYSFWLSDRGYDVQLFDIAERNIQLAIEASSGRSCCPLRSMEVADARNIPRQDESADALLLMGPLYHIVAYDGRIEALREALRVLKPGGLLFAAAITPFASLLWAVSVYGAANRFLDDPVYRRMLETEIGNGQHIRPEGFPILGRAFFHTPEGLAEEISSAGFVDVDVRGVVGPSWIAPDLDKLWKDEEARESLLFAVRLVEREKSLLGMSTHLLAVARKAI